MNTNQIKKARTMLSKAGLSDDKDRLVMEYTNNRTVHLSEMNHQEAQAMFDGLSALMGLKTEPKNDRSPARTKMVRKVLYMAHEMNWELPNSRKVDMNRVNNWCMKHSPFHCKLDDVDTDDLPRLVAVFTKVYESFLKGF